MHACGHVLGVFLAGDVRLSLYLKMSQMLRYLPVCVEGRGGEWKTDTHVHVLLLLQQPHTDVVPIPMDFLPINKGTGQAYGYVLYQTKIPSNSHKIDIVGLKDNGVVREIHMHMYTYNNVLCMYLQTRVHIPHLYCMRKMQYYFLCTYYTQAAEPGGGGLEG